jgi:hypothetical protein
MFSSFASGPRHERGGWPSTRWNPSSVHPRRPCCGTPVEFVAALGINERAAMSQIIANLSLPSREAQWLRDSAMAFLTRDPAWFVRQATLVDERSAPDAVMTMLALAWHHAVVRTAAHPSLTQVLRDSMQSACSRWLPRIFMAAARCVRNPPEMRARVAVYTPEIGGREHGGNRHAAQCAQPAGYAGCRPACLHREGTSIPGVGSYHGGAEFVTAPVVFPDALSLRTQRAVELHIPDVGLSLRQRFDEVRQAIDAFAPYVVVVVGFMSPLAFSLYADYPIVGLPIHALPPLAPVDTWLCARPALDTSAWPGIPAPLAFPFPFRFWPVEAFVPVERDALGLPADACVLITVGYRLPTEMASPWREQMLAFVDRHPAVHWVLIGVLPGEADRFPSHPRVHILPPQTSVAGLAGHGGHLRQSSPYRRWWRGGHGHGTGRTGAHRHRRRRRRQGGRVCRAFKRCVLCATADMG